MHIRWLEESDILALGSVAQRIWNAHYPGIISQEQIDFMLAKSYSPEALAAQLAEGHRFLLAVEGNEIYGFLAVAPLTAIAEPRLRGENVQPADLFLHKFYVVPEAHGKGLGTRLLNELHARIPECKRLRLQVNRRNPNSWNFYLKRGFVIEREADFDIGGGFIMDDYVMEKCLPQE